MQAIIVKDGKGPIENLHIGQASMPTATQTGQVVVKVKMFGVNRMDLIQREGHYPLPSGITPILGVEFSGTIHGLGPGVTSCKVGDEVFGLAYGGAYGQYVLTYAAMVSAKPTHLSFAEAAGIPEVWLTAYQALFLLAALRKGENVLIHAGASGVGIAAIQVARRHGANRVITTAGSSGKLDFLKSMPYGPTHTINYKTEDFSERVKEATNGKGIDVIIDFVGTDYWDKNISSLAFDGRMVHLAILSGHQVPSFSILPIMYKRLTIIGSMLRARTPDYQSELMRRFKEDVLPDIKSASVGIDEGGLRAYVHKVGVIQVAKLWSLTMPRARQVYPWTEIQAAHREMEENRTSGKIIIEITE